MVNSNPVQWLASFTNNTLKLILFVTECCNFRCLYCYEDFKLGAIQPSVILGVKNLLEKRITELDSIQLSFFGGEPLVRKDLVYSISSFAKDLCEKNKVQYFGDILQTVIY